MHSSLEGKIKKINKLDSDISKGELLIEKVKTVHVNLQHFLDKVSKISSKFQCSLCMVFKSLVILGG